MTELAASVVVNNYNYQQFLAQSIESALGQTHSQTEVIVVDDGSTDASREVIRSFDDRIVAIFQENSGQASALETGLRASQGAVVCFLDADDALDHSAIEDACLELARSQAVCIHWPLREVVNGEPTGQIRPRGPIPAGDRLATLLTEGPDSQVHPPTSGSLWRRDFLEKCFPLPPLEHELGIGSASADAYLASLAPLYGPIGSLAKSRGIYRLHARSDYTAVPFEQRLRRDLVTFQARCDAVATHSARLGHSVDPSRWREKSWIPRLARAYALLQRHVPPDTPFVLIDQDQWGMDVAGSRRATMFLEQGGENWGPPADEAVAVRELRRLESQGLRYVVVGWPAFWWLEHYRALGAELRSSYDCVSATDDVIIFHRS